MSARIHGMMAAEAPICVLLRRGPRRSVLCLSWDLTEDIFTLGQWLRGDIAFGLCGLSPDGKLMIYEGFRRLPESNWDREEYDSWTAVSRPPFLTALLHWPKAGGFFDADGTLVYGGLADDLNDSLPPINARTMTTEEMRGDQVQLRREKAGWHLAQEESTPADLKTLRAKAARIRVMPRTPSPFGWSGYDLVHNPRILTLERGPWRVTETTTQVVREFYTQYTAEGPCAPDLTGVDWIEIDHRDRLLYAQYGIVYAADAAGPQALLDTNPMRFKQVPPPDWAKEWPG